MTFCFPLTIYYKHCGGMTVIRGPWRPHLCDLSLISTRLGPASPGAFRFAVLWPLGSACSSNERLVALLMSLVCVPSVPKVCLKKKNINNLQKKNMVHSKYSHHHPVPPNTATQRPAHSSPRGHLMASPNTPLSWEDSSTEKRKKCSTARRQLASKKQQV